MTLSEKIASVNKLERIDSSIESCIKILEQELEKRKVEDQNWHFHIDEFLWRLSDFKWEYFNIMKNKK